MTCPSLLRIISKILQLQIIIYLFHENFTRILYNLILPSGSDITYVFLNRQKMSKT